MEYALFDMYNLLFTHTCTCTETIDGIFIERLQPGYRQFTNISAIVSVFTNGSNISGYSGDVRLELWEKQNLTYDVLYSTQRSVGRNHSSLSVDYPMTVPGVHSLKFVCHNGIPSYAYKDQDVFVAGRKSACIHVPYMEHTV